MRHQSNAGVFIIAAYENYHRGGTQLPAGLLPSEVLLNSVGKYLARGTDAVIYSFWCPPRSRTQGKGMEKTKKPPKFVGEAAKLIQLISIKPALQPQ